MACDSDPPEYEERACWICDGLGHGWVTGWEEVEGKGTVPILASPCPMEEGPYRYDPSEYDDSDLPF